MGMALSEFVTEMEYIFARDDLTDRIGDWLNQAQQKLARMHDFREMERLCRLGTATDGFGTTAEQSRYAIDTRIKKAISVRLIDGSNSRILIPVYAEKMDAYNPLLSNHTSARPTHFVLWDNWIDLFPVPDDIYDIYLRYFRWPTDMSADADESDFSGKDDMLIACAAWMGYSRLQEEDSAKYWFTMFSQELARALLDDARQPGIRQSPYGFNAATRIGTTDSRADPFYSDGT